MTDRTIPDIHTAAQTGYSKVSAAYQTGRPSYPKAVRIWLADTLQITPAMNVVDLGAGTGKFTRILVDTNATIIAVEPVAEMLAQLQSSLPTVQSIQAAATQVPLADESVDVILCAQAFHWFASSEALAEIKRILKPQGRLGLVWNVRDESCDWVAHLTRIMTPYEDGTPRFHEGRWREFFPADGFSELQEQVFDHAHNGSFQNVVIDRVMSVSFIAALPDSEQAKVRQQITEMVEHYPALMDKGDITYPYKTSAFWVQKL